MGRKTKRNKLFDQDVWDQVSDENKELFNEYLLYLRSTDHAETTIDQYSYDLKQFFCWNCTYNKNKHFTEINKRELLKMQDTCINVYEWSSNRLRRYKSTVSSFSDYIENYWDEEFPNFRNIIVKIPSPVKELVREKTIFTDEELEGLLDRLIEDGKYEQMAALALAMYSGRRKAELPRFKMDWFSDENLVAPSLYRTPVKIKTKGRGTKGKLLYCYTVKTKFEKYFNIWKKYREDNGIESEWYLYNPSKISEPILVTTLSSWADSFSKIVNKDFYFHSCRHYACSSLLAAGLPPQIVQQLFGWSDLSLISVYDDRNADDEFSKYFNEDGIIPQEKVGLTDL